MLIKSSDERKIVNLNQIDTLCYESNLSKDCFVIRAYRGNTNTIIGQYKTEERAKEILNEICNEYENIHIVYVMPEE